MKNVRGLSCLGVTVAAIVGFGLFKLAEFLGYAANMAAFWMAIAAFGFLLLAGIDRFSDMEGDGLYHPLFDATAGLAAIVLAVASLGILGIFHIRDDATTFITAVVALLLSVVSSFVFIPDFGKKSR